MRAPVAEVDAVSSVIERFQVVVYVLAASAGWATGRAVEPLGAWSERAVWPALALLLFVTFTQVPWASMRAALRDRRFVVIALLGNFVVMPPVVWALVQVAPADDALRLGLLLVFLVPCTDWFITFTHLGKGDAAAATALTPIVLCVQITLLPLYLWAFAPQAAIAFSGTDLWPAALVVGVPLIAAFALEMLTRDPRRRAATVRAGARWPVPALAVVLFLVAAAHADAAERLVPVLPWVAVVGVVFVCAAVAVAAGLGAVAGLPSTQRRTVAFSLTTRNSFLVLPLALALPPGWEVVALVIVSQSLVELVLLIGLVWWIPRLFTDARARSPHGAAPRRRTDRTPRSPDHPDT